MSNVTYEWVMSHMNQSDMYESCHICMSHLQSSRQRLHQVLFSHQWVMTYIRDMTHSHVISIWVMSHLGGSCHIWMSHVTSEWVMSHLNESCHIWMSHVTFERVMLHLNESCHIWMSHVTYEWVTCKAAFNSRSSLFLTWIRHVTYASNMHKPCHIYMSHVTYTWVMSRMNESYDTWISHVTRDLCMCDMNHELCLRCTSRTRCDSSFASSSYLTWICHVTYAWAVSHIYISHVTYMNESCHIYEWVMSHIWIRHDTYGLVMSQMNESCHRWTSHVALE